MYGMECDRVPLFKFDHATGATRCLLPPTIQRNPPMHHYGIGLTRSMHRCWFTTCFASSSFAMSQLWVLLEPGADADCGCCINSDCSTFCDIVI